MAGIENNCVTDSEPRMGRPSLGVKYTAIRLSPEVLARIDAIMGAPGKRSDFIREAVERLRMREPATIAVSGHALLYTGVFAFRND